MSFIQNPYGSGGYNPTPLGNLTSSIDAIAKTEIAQRLRDIAESKQQLKDDEKWMLTQLPEKIDSMRVAMGQKIGKQTEDFTSMWTDLAKSPKGKPLSLEDKIKISNKMREINSMVGDEKMFQEAYQKMAPQWRTAIAAAKTPEEKKQITDRINALEQKIVNPNYKPITLDLLDPLMPTDKPFRVRLSEFDKEIEPYVKNALTKGREAGTSVRDVDTAVNTIMTHVKDDPTLFEDGITAGQWKNEAEMKKVLYDRVAPMIREDLTGFAPTKQKEADVVVEIPTYVESVDPKVMSGEGVYLPKSGKAFSVTVGQGEDRTAAKFTPTQYVDGVLQGEFKGVKYVKKEGVDAIQAKRDAKSDSRIKVTNVRTVGGKQVADVTAPEVDTWYGSVPYGQVRDEVKEKFPTVDAKYNAEIGAKSAKQTQQRSDVTQDQYAKLKKGETYFYQGKEYTKK